MELKAFKLDIDELINEFDERESTTFAEFKKVWLSKKFSFIFEASPSTNQGCFMQTLYAHSIGYMVSTGSLSNRLAGLYCLYCLYETQPFKPPFRVYLSLEELRRLKILVVDAKRVGVKVVSALLKLMLERNMFLFGFVGVNEGSATERVNELTEIQNARVEAANKKLFTNTRLEHFIHMDLGVELEVDLLKQRSSEYAAAKELAIKEAGQVIDVENVKHIAENKRLIGDVVEKTAADWNIQKELFYEQTRYGHLSTAQLQPTEHNGHFEGQSSYGNAKRQHLQTQEGSENFNDEEDDDEFGKELELMLFEPME